MVATSRDTVDVSDRVERSRDQVRTGALDVTDNDKALKGEKLCPPCSGAGGGECWGGRGRRGGVQRPFAFPIRHTHLEQGLALYDPQKHRALAVLYGHDPDVCCRSVGAVALWLLGYPDQALRQQHAADTLAQEVAHPPSPAFTRMLAAIAHQLRRETHAAHEQAEALIALATEQGFALFLAIGGILRGGTRTALGQRGEQMGQIRQDLAAVRETGSALWEPYFLARWPTSTRKRGRSRQGWPPWPRRWRPRKPRENAGGRRSYIASGGACSCSRRGHRRRRWKPGCSGHWTSPAARRQNRWSCGPQ
jgi:hypothetical protein